MSCVCVRVQHLCDQAIHRATVHSAPDLCGADYSREGADLQAQHDHAPQRQWEVWQGRWQHRWNFLWKLLMWLYSVDSSHVVFLGKMFWRLYKGRHYNYAHYYCSKDIIIIVHIFPLFWTVNVTVMNVKKIHLYVFPSYTTYLDDWVFNIKL